MKWWWYRIPIKIIGDLEEDFMTTDLTDIESLVKKWAAFVHQVGRGYTATIYDYENDVTIRDKIDSLLMKHSSNSVIEFLQLRIEKLDDSFRRITIATENPPWKVSKNKNDPGWWWYRIPKKLVGDLEEDLKNL